ncbi:MAG: thioesterase family protein [Parvibaculaceae bacterium]|nr:thioesterase family protein [Parvibaculaceae bacterium]
MIADTENLIRWDFPAPFIHDVVVEPHHIDAFRHTNNVVYLRWMADTAWEHSRALGLDLDVYRALNRGMVVRRHELEYLVACHEGDKVSIGTWITANDGRLRLRRRFQMVNAATGATLLRGMSDFVCINMELGKATRMPPEFVSAYRLTVSVPESF